MLSGRTLRQDEVRGVWAIDRREVVEAVYYLENGALVLKPEHHEIQGWSRDRAEKYAAILEVCYDRGGWFYGLFDGERLIGVVALDSRFIGRNRDQLQLKFLHLCRDYRDQGLGRRLFELARDEARSRGARQLYISATPSEHTIRFYLDLGCRVTAEPVAELFAMEPGDLHLECDISS
jgi:predicted N-acetyltransferase YhbS